MQLFIGGSCAGKRDAVAARFPAAIWWRLADCQPLEKTQHALVANTPLIIHGVLDWLSGGAERSDDDTLRQQWQSDMTLLSQRANEQSALLIIIATEVGRGIVPMQPAQRRLRDLNGWFTQDVTAQADKVWYVRHGLVTQIK